MICSAFARVQREQGRVTLVQVGKKSVVQPEVHLTAAFDGEDPCLCGV